MQKNISSATWWSLAVRPWGELWGGDDSDDDDYGGDDGMMLMVVMMVIVNVIVVTYNILQRNSPTLTLVTYFPHLHPWDCFQLGEA